MSLNAFHTLKEKLTTTPIIVALDLELSFELMYDANDYAVEAVLEQFKETIFHVKYYASRTLTDAQINYAPTEKEMIIVVFTLDKFYS